MSTVAPPHSTRLNADSMSHSLGPIVGNTRRGVVRDWLPCFRIRRHCSRHPSTGPTNVIRFVSAPGVRVTTVVASTPHRSRSRRAVTTAPRAGSIDNPGHRRERLQNCRTIRWQDRALERVSRETRSDSAGRIRSRRRRRLDDRQLGSAPSSTTGPADDQSGRRISQATLGPFDRLDHFTLRRNSKTTAARPSGAATPSPPRAIGVGLMERADISPSQPRFEKVTAGQETRLFHVKHAHASAPLAGQPG